MCSFSACSVVGQTVTTCASACPQDCFSPANTSCVEVCVVDTCECDGVDEVVDKIVGKCVQWEQCTGESHPYKECTDVLVVECEK